MGWLEDGLRYAKLGWRLIPLHARDKRPHPKAWQKTATTDPEILEQWAERWPDSNLGVVLGPDSGIIDIECDSPAEEELLLKIAGDVGIPVTCCYQSTRGKHRLFKWSADLPCSNKAVFYIGKLGFRTGNGELGAQSALPPSIHPTGTPYKWLVSPDECDPAEIPPEMLARICAAVAEGISDVDEELSALPGGQRKPDSYWRDLAQGVPEGGTEQVAGRNEAAAQLSGKLLGGLADPYDKSAVNAVYEVLLGWNQNNKPPLELKDLRVTFESILRRQQRSWTEKKTKEDNDKSRDRDPETGKPSKAEWRLERVTFTDPVQWRLFGPPWEFSTPAGYLALDTDQLMSGARIRREAADQACVWLEKSFIGFWEGGKNRAGIAGQLIQTCTLVEGSPDESRELILAELLLAQLHEAKSDDVPDHRGAPRKLSDGSVWFKLRYILGQLQFGPEPPSSKELAKLLKQVKAEDRQFAHVGGANARYKKLSPGSLDKLRKRALCGAQAADPTKKFTPREPGDEEERDFDLRQQGAA